MKKASIHIIIFIACVLFGQIGYAMEDGVGIHGFISQGYLQTTQNNYIAESSDGTFQFNEMGINFNHQPLDKLRIGIQFFARDMGTIGNDKIVIDYAFADYRMKDYLGIRAGKMKNPMGLYSEYRDVDMLRSCIILPYSVYDENLRDAQNFIQGAGIYGDVNTASLGSLSYQALVGTNNISTDSSTAFFLEYGMMGANSVEMDTVYSYALQYSEPTGHIRLGATALFTDISMDAESIGHPLFPTVGDAFDVSFNNIEIYTGSFEFIFNNLTISSEIKISHVRNAVYTMVENGVVFFDDHIDIMGYYGMATYRLTDFFELGAYYDRYHFYDQDREGHHPELGYYKHFHWSKKWAFFCKIDLNSNWLLKLETHYTDGTGSIPNAYNRTGSDLYPDTHRYWKLYAVKLSYNF